MEYSGLFDAVDDSPEYAGALLGKLFSMLAEEVAYGYLNELEVTHETGLQVAVNSGGLISNGRFYVNDASKSLDVDAAISGYLRKDRVIVEFDTDNGTATAKISKGDEAVENPSAPVLVNTTTKWQVGLAIVDVDTGTITAVTDDRTLGNSRVNPDFDTDISAPNITTDGAMTSGSVATGDIIATGAITSNGNIRLDDDGKCFFGSSAYIEYDSEEKALYFKVVGLTKVQIATVVVGTNESAPAGIYPVNSIYLEREE